MSLFTKKKRCPKCGEKLPLDQFHKNKAKPDGLRVICKNCAKAYHQKYYKENAEKEKAYSRQWCQDNKEQLKARNKQWNEDNVERIRIRNKQYREEHPDKRREYKRTRRAKKKNAPGEFTEDQFERVKEMFNYCCAACGRHEDECGPLTRDHVRPLTPRPGEVAGTNDISNIQPLCFSCNSQKGNRYRDYRKKGFLKNIFQQRDLFGNE